MSANEPNKSSLAAPPRTGVRFEQTVRFSKHGPDVRFYEAAGDGGGEVTALGEAEHQAKSNAAVSQTIRSAIPGSSTRSQGHHAAEETDVADADDLINRRLARAQSPPRARRPSSATSIEELWSKVVEQAGQPHASSSTGAFLSIATTESDGRASWTGDYGEVSSMARVSPARSRSSSFAGRRRVSLALPEGDTQQSTSAVPASTASSGFGIGSPSTSVFSHQLHHGILRHSSHQLHAQNQPARVGSAASEGGSAYMRLQLPEYHGHEASGRASAVASSVRSDNFNDDSSSRWGDDEDGATFRYDEDDDGASSKEGGAEAAASSRPISPADRVVIGASAAAHGATVHHPQLQRSRSSGSFGAASDTAGSFQRYPASGSRRFPGTPTSETDAGFLTDAVRRGQLQGAAPRPGHGHLHMHFGGKSTLSSLPEDNDANGDDEADADGEDIDGEDGHFPSDMELLADAALSESEMSASAPASGPARRAAKAAAAAAPQPTSAVITRPWRGKRVRSASHSSGEAEAAAVYGPSDMSGSTDTGTMPVEPEEAAPPASASKPQPRSISKKQSKASASPGSYDEGGHPPAVSLIRFNPAAVAADEQRLRTARILMERQAAELRAQAAWTSMAITSAEMDSVGFAAAVQRTHAAVSAAQRLLRPRPGDAAGLASQYAASAGGSNTASDGSVLSRLVAALGLDDTETALGDATACRSSHLMQLIAQRNEELRQGSAQTPSNESREATPAQAAGDVAGSPGATLAAGASSTALEATAVSCVPGGSSAAATSRITQADCKPQAGRAGPQLSVSADPFTSAPYLPMPYALTLCPLPLTASEVQTYALAARLFRPHER